MPENAAALKVELTVEFPSVSTPPITTLPETFAVPVTANLASGAELEIPTFPPVTTYKVVPSVVVFVVVVRLAEVKPPPMIVFPETFAVPETASLAFTVALVPIPTFPPLVINIKLL